MSCLRQHKKVDSGDWSRNPEAWAGEYLSHFRFADDLLIYALMQHTNKYCRT